MAIFSGKILTAHYINPEYSIVELTYTGEDGGVYAHALRVDPDNPEWQALLEDGWDQERLIEGTAEYKRISSMNFNIEVNNAAKTLAKSMADEIATAMAKKMVKEKYEQLEVKATLAAAKETNISLDAPSVYKVQNEELESIIFNNENKDIIFKFKLWILEQDFVKGCTKEQKSEIRKASRLTELFALIDKLV